MEEKATGSGLLDERDYQSKSISEIKDYFRKDIKRVLLWLATGGGKTFIFCKMVKDSHLRGKSAIVIVRGRKLVDQASKRLIRERVPHGVLMANHWNYRPHFPIQVCSIDTLIARGLRPKADLIIVDEAHMAISKGYKEFLQQYPDAFVVGVTATPYSDTSMRHIADAIVHPITMQGLIDLNFLVPFRYFAPQEPDLSDVKISASTHDYVNHQLEGKMLSGQLTGKIIEHYAKISKDLPAICFAVNKHHSKILRDRFVEDGIAAEHVEDSTSDTERENVIRRLVSGQAKVICNVGILCTGVDIPPLRTVIMARPTKSRNLFIQQAGRGTRISKGKQFCFLLDHAGNIRRHGFPTMEPDVDLDGKVISERGELGIKVCKNCFACYRGKLCPECGIEIPTIKTDIIESEEQLTEIVVTTKNPVEQWLEYLEQQRREKKFKNGWQYHKLIEKFGIEKAKPYIPTWFKLGSEDDPFARSPFKGVKA